MPVDDSTKSSRTRRSVVVQVGEVYGRLTVISEPFIGTLSPLGGPMKCVICRCSCGVERHCGVYLLFSGQTKSCGCLRRDRSRETALKTATFRKPPVHGERWTRLYRIWLNINSRCNNPKAECYQNYGGRGITVCPEWRDYMIFAEWAKGNGYRDDLTIERKDVDGNYRPDNCTWIPNRDQGLNKTTNRFLTAFGETKSVIAWLRDPRCKVRRGCLDTRLSLGHDSELALTLPPGTGRIGRRPKS